MLLTLRELAKEISTHLRRYQNLKGTVEIVQKYAGNDWLSYIRNDIIDYTRVNVPLKINKPLFDIFVMSWPPCQTSQFHNHSKGGCVMKVLTGRLKENRFLLPDKRENMQILFPNDIGYMSDEIGYHSITNPSPLNYAYSLHVYYPSGHQTQYFNSLPTTE